MIEQGDNNASLIRSLPWRDRLAILAVIGVVTVLSWVYLVDMAIDMDSMMRSDSMQEMGSGGDG
jgi:predicted metal-binding membrane protein